MNAPITTPLIIAARSAVDEIAEYLLACGLNRALELLAERSDSDDGPESDPVPATSEPEPRLRAHRPLGTNSQTTAAYRAQLVQYLSKHPGSTMADASAALGWNASKTRYYAKGLVSDGLVRNAGGTSNARWYLAEQPPASADEPDAPTTQRSERPAAIEVPAATTEQAILKHLLERGVSSIQGILRAVCPDWQEATLGRLLHVMEGRKLVTSKRGRSGLVSWSLPMGGRE